jgi:Flp pilus assembly protein TadD
MNDTKPSATAASWRTCVLVMAAAFVVKLVVLLQLRDHPLLLPHGELDTAFYVALGQDIARDGLLAPGEAFFVSPLYVYFLAAIFSIGGSLLAAQLVQIGLGSAAVGLLFATARHWFGERAAMVAAGLAVLTGLFTFYEVLVLQSALDPFLVAFALYALTRTTTSDRTLVFALAGVLLGLLALNRPNALVFAAAATGGVFVTQWRRSATDRAFPGTRGWRIPVGRATAMLASLLLVLAANAARSYAVSGHAIVISSHGGLNFYIGNHGGADGTYTPIQGISPSIAGQARDATRIAEAGAGRRLSPGEVSGYFEARAYDWMTSDPAGALLLFVRKVRILLNRVDVPLNYSFAYYASGESTVLHMLAAGPWLLLPLGLTGLFWPSLRVRRHGYWLWAAFVPAYGMAVAVFFVSDRYRMPLLVPLCATAGATIVRFCDLARARRGVPLLVPAVAVAAGALVAFSDLGLDDGIGGEQARMAVWLIEQGNVEDARRYVERISPGHSHPGVLSFRAGQALLDAGRHADAVDPLRRALAIDGPRPAIRLALGEALAGSGRPGEAAGHLEAACDSGYDMEVAGPLLVRALVLAGRHDDAVSRLSTMRDSVAGTGVEVALDFGTLAIERGAPAQAARWLRLAVGRAPVLAEAHEKLGLAMFLQGDAQGALPHLEHACSLDPASASAQLNLGAAYAELGRFPEARLRAEEAHRLDPAERRAADLLRALPRKGR